MSVHRHRKRLVVDSFMAQRLIIVARSGSPARVCSEFAWKCMLTTLGLMYSTLAESEEPSRHPMLSPPAIGDELS